MRRYGAPRFFLEDGKLEVKVGIKELVIQQGSIIRFVDKSGKVAVTWRVEKLEENAVALRGVSGTANAPIFKNPDELGNHVENMIFNHYEVSVGASVEELTGSVANQVVTVIETKKHNRVITPVEGKGFLSKEQLSAYEPKAGDIIEGVTFTGHPYTREITEIHAGDLFVQYVPSNGFPAMRESLANFRHHLSRNPPSKISTDMETLKQTQTTTIDTSRIMPESGRNYLTSDQKRKYEPMIGDTIEGSDAQGNLFKLFIDDIYAGTVKYTYSDPEGKIADISMSKRVEAFKWVVLNDKITSILRDDGTKQKKEKAPVAQEIAPITGKKYITIDQKKAFSPEEGDIIEGVIFDETDKFTFTILKVEAGNVDYRVEYADGRGNADKSRTLTWFKAMLEGEFIMKIKKAPKKIEDNAIRPENGKYLSEDQISAYEPKVGDVISGTLGSMLVNSGKRFKMTIIAVDSEYITYTNGPGQGNIGENRPMFRWDLHHSNIELIERQK